MAYVIWRVSDQVIVYANDFAINAFGGNESFIGKISLWDIIGPADESLIILESRRSDPQGGPDIHLPDEAFATFKRLDNGKLFTAWYRAKDIHEPDGSTLFRVAILFTNYDRSEDDANWEDFITQRASRIERELAASVAHDLNNSLAILQTEIEEFSTLGNVDLGTHLQDSFKRLADLGLKMHQLAHISKSVISANSENVLATIMPAPALKRPFDEGRGNLRVLVIDDEPTLVSGLCSIMTTRGVEALGAANSKEACFKALAFKPHSALIDIMLGEEDGFDLGKQLTELLPDINVVYMSGFARHAPSSVTREQKKILKKPFEVDLAISFLKEGLVNDNRD